MSDEKKDPKKGGEFRVPPRTWILWIVILGAIPLLLLFRDRPDSGREKMTEPAFIKLLESSNILTGTVWADVQSLPLQEITGTCKKPDGAAGTFSVWTQLDDDLNKKLRDYGKFDRRKPNTVLQGMLVSVLPILLIAVLIWFVVIRQIKMAGKGALSFGKSKARLLAKEKNKTTFKDVAGIEEAKEEVQELVEFLKDPKRFQKLGGRIPKGILMVGPPGTGKTLLAKAIAGEADASFFSISGSDFVEMFVGVGASRVRDMFEQARKNTPCLVFIDEIDAVGRSRGHGLGGGNDEREQTLN